MGMVAGVTANFGPFCSKDFSSGVSSFLERLITHLSWIPEEVNAVLKVLVVLGDHLEGSCGGSGDEELGCSCTVGNVFSLLLKIMFSRSVKVGHLVSIV